MVTRLSTGDWFTAKVSACGLFTAAYKHISEPDQRTLLRAQVELCWTSLQYSYHLACWVASYIRLMNLSGAVQQPNPNPCRHACIAKNDSV